jgi:hypothetical protein
MLRTQIVTPNILGMKKLAVAAVVAVALKAVVIAGRVRAGPAATADRAVMDRADLVQADPVAPVAEGVPAEVLADRVRKARVDFRVKAVASAAAIVVAADLTADSAGAKMIVPRPRRCRPSTFRLFRRKKASNRSRAKSN